jgi:hypothetical protein
VRRLREKTTKGGGEEEGMYEARREDRRA